MSRPTLGVVAISYNEERDMPQFLSHLSGWVDEVVIVDDGSTDGTEEIVSRFGGNVSFLKVPRQAGQYFSHQRNKGIAFAASDWLLHMDVDERVSPELAREILNAIESDSCDAYRFRRLNYFLHRPMRGGGWQDWNQVHLARRGVLKFGGMSHETCLVDAPEKRIGQLRAPMHHLNDSSYRERLEKSSRYVEEAAVIIGRRQQCITGTSIIYRTLREFVYRYILRFGFRDGTAGLVAALHSATATFRAHAIVWDEQHGIAREALEYRWVRAAMPCRRGGED